MRRPKGAVVEAGIGGVCVRVYAVCGIIVFFSRASESCALIAKKKHEAPSATSQGLRALTLGTPEEKTFAVRKRKNRSSVLRLVLVAFFLFGFRCTKFRIAIVVNWGGRAPLRSRGPVASGRLLVVVLARFLVRRSRMSSRSPRARVRGRGSTAST